MSKFICYGMKVGSSINTLARVTEEDLIKAKVDCFNYSLEKIVKDGSYKWKMNKKPFEALKDSYSHAIGKGYMYGKFRRLIDKQNSRKVEEIILIYGYELGSVENAKKIMLEKRYYENEIRKSDYVVILDEPIDKNKRNSITQVDYKAQVDNDKTPCSWLKGALGNIFIRVKYQKSVKKIYLMTEKDCKRYNGTNDKEKALKSCKQYVCEGKSEQEIERIYNDIKKELGLI